MYAVDDSCQDESAAKRRKIRKGTRSCQECRRRKVKCNYATPDNTTCIVCERRGAQCISQWDSVESNDAVNKASDTGAKADGDDPVFVRVSTASDLGSTQANDPTVTLDSDTISQLAAVSAQRATWIAKKEDDHSHRNTKHFASPEPQAHAAIRQALLRALPCETDIGILFEQVSIVSAICYQSDYKSHYAGLEETPEEQIVVRSLQEPESHPTLLARQMLLFAAAVQHLSPATVVPGLTEHHHVIMNRLAETAIKLVNMDDSLLGTLEGLENLIFEFFYHIDSGNIRRAWITTRRAVTVSQMLALHQRGRHRFTLINDESNLEPEVMWSTIVSMERMLSLLLGLPTSTGHMTLACHMITSDSAPGHNVSALVGHLTAKILERNQLEPAPQALLMTGEIDREIILAAEQMPSVFWRPLNFTRLEKDSLKALSETRRAFGHMCYYSLVVQLHLPYMLSPDNVLQRMYSKIACVNAGREILTRQIELRTFDPLSARCRMGDFLALIAGMTLMLGHITSHGGNEGDHLLAHQRLGDRAIVDRVLDCIDPISDLHEDVFAVRCATLLRDLLTIEENVARRSSLHASQPHDTKTPYGNQHNILIMRVPHLGNIQITQGGVVALPEARIKQVESISEGVVVGGIGSMLIGQPQRSDSHEDHDNTNGIMPPVAYASATSEPSQYDMPLISTGLHMQPDLAFPDAAASFDDWVFQGVDTAFMETLMRGSAISLSDELGDGRWDINTLP